ncbi:ABC transporter substrate-binding protein [Roseivivax halodurans JCM 10272]|uniref:ABC transporter substrate-binding protein n=1 Tax=Roseivivax halodurans JCM 10272 TaxID=1449350 RepID=X7ED17_9RHOB|nr:ABC transporter substrate-binding protein [Roseivivax halodurans]ETX13008.1 ABC transporter substrate-binding protein [Roseivivax halodurans JCM 10272]
MRQLWSMLLAGMVMASWSVAAQAVEVRTAVLRIDYPTLAPISRYDERPDDLGFAGAALAAEDNGTTGQFLGHTYETETVAVPPEEADAALAALLDEGIDLVVILARDEDLLRLANQAGPEVLVLNALAEGDALRGEACRANVLHVAPSYAMEADAVAQFAVFKKWSRWFLIEGSNEADRAMGEAYRRAAEKFGARVVEDRIYEDTGGARRTDTGHVMVQRQLPVFTQDASDHQIVVAADATGYFAPYLPFHLWDPRPVMGSAGLRPVSFHGAHEAWGATQFQTRFDALAGRYVREEDYQTWLALRVIGEAVTRTGSADADAIRDYALGDEFELAAFKGVPVSFRQWNGQLRQPILLYDGRITASVSPQDGFLHQSSPLDTLGIDEPESTCTAFQ